MLIKIPYGTLILFKPLVSLPLLPLSWQKKKHTARVDIIWTGGQPPRPDPPALSLSLSKQKSAQVCWKAPNEHTHYLPSTATLPPHALLLQKDQLMSVPHWAICGDYWLQITPPKTCLANVHAHHRNYRTVLGIGEISIDRIDNANAMLLLVYNT